MMAQQGKKVLLIGCDPKSDTTSLLFGGRACPTIIETSSKKKLAGEAVQIGDVCFKRDGVFAMELGGPEVGRGCGGRGIIHGFELLEKLGFHEWGFDYVLLDFLGDVVCGGFGLPIARDMCQKVIVVGSNDLQSLYVANNVCSAVEYFRKLGGNVGVAGMVINKDDGTGEAAAFADARRHPGAGRDPRARRHPPQERELRDHRPSRHASGRPLFETLAQNVADAPPVRPTPLTQDELLGLFSGDAVGRDVVLEPATQFDMCGRSDDREAVARSGLRHRLSARQSRPATLPPMRRPETAPRIRPLTRPTASAAMRARTRCARRRTRPARARRSTATRATTRRARTTSRNRCARRSAPCASACACGAPRPCCRARPAACTA